MSDHKKSLARLWQLCQHTEALTKKDSFGALIPVMENTRGINLSCTTLARHCIARLTKLNKLNQIVALRSDAFEHTLSDKKSRLEKRLSSKSLDADALNLTQTEVLALSKPEMENAACRMEVLENDMDLEFAARSILVFLSVEQQFRTLAAGSNGELLNSYSRNSLNEFIITLPAIVAHIGQVQTSRTSLKEFKNTVDNCSLKLADEDIKYIEAIKLLVKIWDQANKLANENLRSLAMKIEDRYARTKQAAQKYTREVSKITLNSEPVE